jgi:GNAT superfamily N-acetyltransferase
MCECYIIGGPWIAEDPDCPEHGTEAQARQREVDANWAKPIEVRIIKTYEDLYILRDADVGDHIWNFNRHNLNTQSRTYFAALRGEQLVGVAAISETTVWHENSIGVGYISTHDEYKQGGVSKAIVEALFQYAKSSKRNISNSRYEPDGELYLRRMMTAAAARHPEVILFERDA